MPSLSRGLSLTLILSILGCATPYTSHGLTGGYREERIDETHYRVRFDGNGFATKERVWSFWFYRCAELTKEKGYTFFILDETAGKKASLELSEPAPIAAFEPPMPPAPAAAGGSRYVYIPGQTITTWHTNAVITLCGEPAPPRKLLFKAQDVMGILEPYVRSNGQGQAPERLAIFKAAAYVVGPEAKTVKVADLLPPEVKPAAPAPPESKPVESPNS